jgi:hypothetical protein
VSGTTHTLGSQQHLRRVVGHNRKTHIPTKQDDSQGWADGGAAMISSKNARESEEPFHDVWLNHEEEEEEEIFVLKQESSTRDKTGRFG